jgi:precorrin-6y C5,15-methyltransferase (decarboxylating) CbiE subunit
MSSDNTGIAMTVVAVGPGDPRMLTMRGRQALEAADLVVGFKTVLDVVTEWCGGAEVRPMSYRDQEEVLEYAAGQAGQGKNCVVCCWGDLNVSAHELLARVYRRAETVELIPGVSSIQIACARAGIALEESLFITLHRRDGSEPALAELERYLREGLRNIILLPRPFDLMPPGIASDLVAAGISAERPVTVYQRLTLEGEKAWSGTLQECADLSEEFSDLSIMVFLRSTSDQE